jgi:hypothetical protein
MHLNSTYRTNSYIFADSWDRFGGRALDILNGFTLSNKLGCNFAFYWPEDERFPEMEEQIQFFSTEFIEKFRINFNPPASQVRYIDFNELTQDSAKKALTHCSEVMYFRNPNVFALPRFLDEDDASARDSYIQSGLAVISSLNLELWEKIKASYSDFDSIHARYGDLLDGSFNQFVDPRKYVDTFNLLTLVKKLSQNARKPMILSDTPEISVALEKLTKSTLRPDLKIFETPKNLSLFELQTIELFTLASSRCIFAPNLSAFSFLASRLGGNELRFIRSETGNEFYFDERPTCIRKHYRGFSKNIKNQTITRDLVSILQHYWKDFEIKKVVKIVQLAHRHDSDYVTSICLLGIVEALKCNKRKSRLLIEKAEVLARSKLKVHHDPLFVALIVKYCTLDGSLVSEKKAILEEIETLYPYQILKVNALDFLEKFESLQKNSIVNLDLKFSAKLQFQKRLQEIWHRIIESGETELLYGLLKLLKLSNLK